MGAASSVQANEGNPDPLCPLHTPPLHAASNGLAEEERNTLEIPTNGYGEEVAVEEVSWTKQIQDLGKVVHNLATENLKLLSLNRELKLKCEELGSKLSEKCTCEEEREGESLRLICSLQKESIHDKRIIEDLKEQLQANTENGAVEVEKYRENLNLMYKKVKEYEQIMDKLEEDKSVQNQTMQPNESYLLLAGSSEKDIEESSMEMNGTLKIEMFQKEQKVYQEENKDLREQLEIERNIRRKVDDENKKLKEELLQIKHGLCVNSVNITSGKIDVDDSNVVVNGEIDILSPCSSSTKREETKTLSTHAAAELEVFQNQMKVKREARHKALSAISMEMEKLRKELNGEREERRNAVRELETLRSMSDMHHISGEINDLQTKLRSERLEKDRIYKEMIEIQKQGNTEVENVLKELEKEKEKSKHILGENKVIKEQLEESDQQLQLHLEENSQLQNKLDTDREKYQKQVLALKDVVAISKQMLTVRENQVTHLKQTLQDIEASVIQKHRGSLTAELRAEYETQMENIKALKSLYEERMQVMNAEKDKLMNEQEVLRNIIEEEKRAVNDLEVKLQEKDEVISERNATVSDLQDQLSDAVDQSRNLSYELSLINNMFTQILGSTDMDLDRLTKLLQENHDLITEITTKSDCSETTASLPKLLLDLVCDAENAVNYTDGRGQVYSNEEPTNTCSSSCGVESEAAGELPIINPNINSLAKQDISSNLPKVWKILLELVSHHIPSPSEESTEESKTSCYKSVDTPHGPQKVISVSKTFLRLRDLILQKKSLQKEVTRLKQLNVHLETKLSDQERRLSTVSTELRKTWNVVDHMLVQHQQLHTHEKVLRYELQQKRKLLMELKEELEYCREKWEEARQKNSQSEVEWQKLRKEFALRKSKPLNNSGESGFSEEKDEDNSENDALKSHPQRKSSNNELNNFSQSPCNEQFEMETDNSENPTNSSLPDLVSVTADHTHTMSNVSLINDETRRDCRESLTPLQNFTQDGSSILEPTLEECPTESLITLLKQQLSCFSKNLEIITTCLDTSEHLRALQSIFSLPAIQIPEHLNPTSDESPTSFPKVLHSDLRTRASVDRGIQCNEDYNYNSGKSSKEVSSENILQEPKLNLNSNENQIPFDPTLMTLADSDEAECSCSTSSHASLPNIQGETRSERLLRMERQCQELFNKVTRGSDAKNTAENIHQIKSQESTNSSTRNFEDMLDARAARLKRLEEQSQQLFKKVKRTTNRSTELSNRLEELHEQFGNENAASSTMTDYTTSENSNTVQIDSKILDHPPPVSTSPDYSKASETKFQDSSIPLSESSTSSSPVPAPSQPPLEDRLQARAERLRRLEEQSQQLLNKVTGTTHRSIALSNRLEELHELYGSEVTEVEGNAPVSTGMSSTQVLSEVPESSPLPALPNDCKSSKLLVECSSESTVTLPEPSSSAHVLSPSPSPLQARAEQLRRLEEESQQLPNNVTGTTHHSIVLSNRLEELHEQFGNEDTDISTYVPPGTLCDQESSEKFNTPLSLTRQLSESSATSQSTQMFSNESCCFLPSTSLCPIPQPLDSTIDSCSGRSDRFKDPLQQPNREVEQAMPSSSKLSKRLEELNVHSSDNTCGSTISSIINIPEAPPLPDPLMTIEIPTCLQDISNDIPMPPPLPCTLPSLRLPTQMDQLRQHDNEEMSKLFEEEQR